MRPTLNKPDQESRRAGINHVAPTLRKPPPITAGGDTITGANGTNTHGAAIGKNIIVIGMVKEPVLPLLVLILIVIGAATFFGLRLLSLAKMTGSPNLAVAEFGQIDASGQVATSYLPPTGPISNPRSGMTA